MEGAGFDTLVTYLTMLRPSKREWRLVPDSSSNIQIPSSHLWPLCGRRSVPLCRLGGLKRAGQRAELTGRLRER
eukprot:2349508-Pyramimonas_sp.AAC.1